MSEFPSIEHHNKLVERLKNAQFSLGALSETETWAWFAYNYGWRRVMLQTRADDLPIDPNRKWFSAEFSAIAEIFWCKKWGKRAPGISALREDPTEEQIAEVGRKTEIAVANIEQFINRNRISYRDTSMGRDNRDAIKRFHEAMNVTAKESEAAE